MIAQKWQDISLVVAIGLVHSHIPCQLFVVREIVRIQSHA